MRSIIVTTIILSHVYGATMTGAEGARAPVIQRFYLARFARTYQLHLATLLALVAVELSAYVPRLEIAGASTGDRKTWEFFLQHLTLTQAWLTMSSLEWRVPSWSISTGAFAYLLLPVLLLPLVDHDKWAVRALLPAAAMAIYVHTFSKLSNAERQQPLARCIAGLTTGMLVHRVWRRKVGWMAPVQLATVVIVLAALHHGWNQSLALVASAALILATAADRESHARWRAGRRCGSARSRIRCT